MLISIQQFGGIAPKVLDPELLPENKSQRAINCRFGSGGIIPLQKDAPVDAREGDILSLYRYQNGRFFAWQTDVDVVAAPVVSDIYKRVYYTEGGLLKVTDKDAYKDGGTNYPAKSYIASPPAPTTAPTVESAAVGISLSVADPRCHEKKGTRSLNFTGGVGSGAEGTYTIDDNTITSADLTNAGAYTEPPSVSTSSGDGVIHALLGADPTLMQTRGYCYTFVTAHGAEGPPSPVSSLISVYDGQRVTIGGLGTSVPTGHDNITKKRVYRLNQSSTGAVYQFVAELNLNIESFQDTILSSALGEVMQSDEWEAPPVGIKGLIALPDGSLAGFVDNVLCRSVPYYPHAWPASYQKAVERPIVALGSFGTTIVVLTSGMPYLAVGSSPDNVVMEEMDLGYSCVSKRGTVQAGDAVIYPAPEGLIIIGPNIRDNLTAAIMTQTEWANYNPASLSAHYWDGHYVAFYESKGRRAGFMINIQTKEFSELSFFSPAGYREPGSGTLYLVM